MAERPPERADHPEPSGGSSGTSTETSDSASAVKSFVIKGFRCAYDTWADDVCRVVARRFLEPRGDTTGCSALVQYINKGEIDLGEVSIASFLDWASDASKVVAGTLSGYKAVKFIVCMAS